MNAAVHDVEVGDREPGRRPLGPQRLPEGLPRREGDGPCRSHRHPDDGVGAEAGLRCGSVEFDDRSVQLRGARERPTDEELGDLALHVGDRGENALAGEAVGVAVAQLDGFARPCRRPRRHAGARARPVGERHRHGEGGPRPRVEDFDRVEGRNFEHHRRPFRRNDPSFLDKGPAHQGTTSRFAGNPGPSPVAPRPGRGPAGPERSLAASRPVGGILSSERNAPGGGHPSMRPTWGHRAGSPSHAWPCSGWGLPSRSGHPDRWCALTAPFHPCLCLAAIGGLLSVALSFGSPRLAVSQHPALRSPDLPRTRWVPPPPRPPGRLAAGSIVALAIFVATDVAVRNAGRTHG